MKLLELNTKKGIIKALPQNLDDLWHLYNIILPKDRVYARTTRQVKLEEEYMRPQKGKRVSVFLGIIVEKVEWDRSLDRLRIYGVICDVPENVGGKGTHHTITVAAHKPLTIVKVKLSIHEVERLKRASRAKGTPIIIIGVDDEGFYLAKFRQYGVDILAEKHVQLPSKLEAEKRIDAINNFFKTLSTALRRVWMKNHNPIVVLGVGFLKKDFIRFLNRKFPEAAEKIVDVKSVNSSGTAGVHEALRSGVLDKAFRHVRVVEESRVVEDILSRLGRGEGKVAYGKSEVKKACEFGAVELLVLVDSFLRQVSNAERLEVEQWMRRVEEKGGRVMVISSEHEAGEKLSGLGGVGALLRFSIS